jgi:nucleoside permease NupC
MPAISGVCCAWIQSVNLNTETVFNAVDIAAQGCFFVFGGNVSDWGQSWFLDVLDVVVPPPLKEERSR